MNMGVCANGRVCAGCVCAMVVGCMHTYMNCVHAYPSCVYAYGVVCA